MKTYYYFLKLKCATCKKVFERDTRHVPRNQKNYFCTYDCFKQSMRSFQKGHKPWNLGIPHSEETKRKISELHKGNNYRKGSKLTKEHKHKLSVAHLGKKLSEATKIKMGLYKKDEENHNWKGSKVGYHGLHDWVRKHLGTPNKCSHCGKIDITRRIHWANKSGKYLRDLTDWIRLCVKCHSKYDHEREINGVAYR